MDEPGLIWVEAKPRIDRRGRERWYAGWYDKTPDGEPIRRRRCLYGYGVRSKAEADAWVAMEAKYRDALRDDVLRQPSPTECLARFLEAKAQNGLKPKTLKLYRQVLRDFAASTPLATGRTIEDYLNGLLARGIAPGTRNTRLFILRAAFRWLAAKPRQYVPNDPTEGIEILKTSEFHAPRIGRAAAAAVYREAQKADPFWGMVVRILFETGLRRQDVAYLEWPDVLLTLDEHAEEFLGTIEMPRTTVSCVLAVRSKPGWSRKCGDELLVPVTDDLAMEIWEYRKALAGRGLVLGWAFRPWVQRQYGLAKKSSEPYQWGSHETWGTKAVAAVRAAYAAAGIPVGRRLLHDFRAEAATDGVESGADRALVQKAMGWGSSKVMEEAYVRQAQLEAAKKMLTARKLEGLLKGDDR